MTQMGIRRRQKGYGGQAEEDNGVAWQ